MFDDRGDQAPDGSRAIAWLGTIDDLVQLTRTFIIDEIIVALPWQSAVGIHEIIKKLKSVPVNVKICPDYVGWSLPVRGFQAIAGMPMLTRSSAPLSGWNMVLKALEDRIFAAILLVMLLPVLLLVALAIRSTARGPVMFRQRRYGFNGEQITSSSSAPCSMRGRGQRDAGAAQRSARDPVGRLPAPHLASTSCRSSSTWSRATCRWSARARTPSRTTSCIAPRSSRYMRRHKVKPGITGWAQVNGLRGETDTLEKMVARVEHDLYYIHNWSLRST